VEERAKLAKLRIIAKHLGEQSDELKRELMRDSQKQQRIVADMEGEGVVAPASPEEVEFPALAPGT
jgi:hypothetical protein